MAAYRFGRVRVTDPIAGELILEGDGFAAGYDPIRLAVDETVQRHLALSADQRQRASEIWQAHRAALDAAHAEDASPVSLEQARLRSATRSRAALESVLGDTRYAKLQRLAWRIRGGDALRDPAVAAALALTEAQKTQVEALAQEADASLEELRRELQRVRLAAHAFEGRILAHERQASERLLAVLSESQRQRFDEMTAEKD